MGRIAEIGTFALHHGWRKPLAHVKPFDSIIFFQRAKNNMKNGRL